MGIAGDDMGVAPAEHPHGGILCPPSEGTQDTALVDLEHDAPVEPLRCQLRIPLHRAIALRVSHHRKIAHLPQPMEGLVHESGTRVKIELRQHIPPRAQGGESSRLRQLHRLGHAEHLRTGQQLHFHTLPLQPALKKPKLMPEQAHRPQRRRLSLEVGRCDDLFHAAVPGDLRHSHRGLHIPCAVVHLRQDMTVDVHHCAPLLSCWYPVDYTTSEPVRQR